MSGPHPLTRAESTGFRETSLHADVMHFLTLLDGWQDPRMWLGDFGASPEGRTLPLVVLSARGAFTPEAAHALGLPVMLVLGGIHAGEVEGKEALQAWMRDLLASPKGELLEHLTLVVAPLFNPDGNDRIDPANRKLDIKRLFGQIGPDTGVGTRVNAAGINLNRDYLRQDAPEMRQMAREVYQRWNPHLTLDCHATNGSIHRYALTYDTPHTTGSGRVEPIRYARERLLPEIRGRVQDKHGLEMFWYGNFARDEGGEDPGWMTYTHHPRFGSNYRGLTNRLDILAETYSYLPFPERVHATRCFVEETAGLLAERGPEVVELLADCQTPPERVAVQYRLEAEDAPVRVLTREPYALDGDAVAVTVPHYARFVGTHVVNRPFAYVIPEALAPRLDGHGLRVRRLDADTLVELEEATVTAVHSPRSRGILESSLGERQIEAEHRTVSRTLPAGSCLVETEQPHGAVAVYLCEAMSDDGIIACGWISEPAPGDVFPVSRLLTPV